MRRNLFRWCQGTLSDTFLKLSLKGDKFTADAAIDFIIAFQLYQDVTIFEYLIALLSDTEQSLVHGLDANNGSLSINCVVSCKLRSFINLS